MCHPSLSFSHPADPLLAQISDQAVVDPPGPRPAELARSCQLSARQPQARRGDDFMIYYTCRLLVLPP